MPQLDFAFYPAQIFWLLVCFFILYFSIKYWLLPPLTKVILKREDTVKSILRQADEMNDKAKQLDDKYSNYLKRVDDDVARMLNDAHEQMARSEMEQDAEIKKQIDDDLLQIKKEADSQRRMVFKHLNFLNTRLIDIVVFKIYGLKTDKKAIVAGVKKTVRGEKNV